MWGFSIFWIFVVTLLTLPVTTVIHFLVRNRRIARLLHGVSLSAWLGLALLALLHAPPSDEALLAQFSVQVKQVADVATLQNWAKTQPEIQDAEKARDVVPGALRKLISQRLEMEMVTWESDNAGQPVVKLWWGGGFRHWGLDIGQPSYKFVPMYGAIFAEWTPGVYFWVGD